jgi:hypothetical protein
MWPGTLGVFRATAALYATGEGPPNPETKAASLDGFIEVTPFLVGWVSVL